MYLSLLDISYLESRSLWSSFIYGFQLGNFENIFLRFIHIAAKAQNFIHPFLSWSNIVLHKHNTFYFSIH